MNQPEGISILYLYCSKEAYDQDGREVKVTETFSVSTRVARRYNFWRRIYSLWGEDQYVMHAAEYPEVILEIGDASPLGSNVSWVQKKNKVQKVLDQHRWQYKQMLREMHKYRNKPEAFSPAMRRIAAQMEHIADPNKYMLAAGNVRIQRGQRDQIAAGLSMAARYMDAVAEAFLQEGLPQELSQLAFIESSFNLQAYSKVGAAGVYQIMPSTGRQYMLVTDTIDERRDPIKSAHAAAKLLKLNYSILGEWPLAVTAYNHGAGGIGRAVRTVGSNKLEDLIEKYNGPAFGFASKNFFSGFLAVMATIAESDRLFPEVRKLAPLRFEEIRLTKATGLAEIKKQHNLTNEIMYLYNPDITRSHVRANGVLPRNYRLKIPTFQDRISGVRVNDPESFRPILTGAGD
jgi:membrane-bound lytic murein transglycosylase D